MKVLYLTLEPPMDPALVVRGNAIRASGLIGALRGRGVEVVQAWRAPDDGSRVPDSPSMYANAGGLAALIEAAAPDAVIAAYWNLVLDLPRDLNTPVVVDFIAPRPLEALYEDTRARDTETPALLEALGRARGFVVANARQEHFLLPYLLMAGHDPRPRAPIARVPVMPLRPLPDPAGPPEGRITFVAGGVDWPWRRHRRWLDAAANALGCQAGSARLIEFGGGYPRIVERPDAVPEAPGDRPASRLDLLSYRDYSRFLSQAAHVGLELADENVERYFSQSFRLVDYLSHGLPVVCNRYVSIAKSIEAYDAGWTVSDPGELRQVVDELVSTPGCWRRKQAHVLQFVERELAADDAVAPLVDLLETLSEAAPRPLPAGGAFRTLAEHDRAELERLQSENARMAEARDAQQRAMGELRRQVQELWERNRQLSGRIRKPRRLSAAAVFREARRAAVRRLPKPADARPPGNVLMVTRSDLFPTDHGAAVKIVETARGLSRNGRDVGIVTDRPDVWWHCRDGVIRARRYPRWLGLISWPSVIRARIDPMGGFDVPNAFLYQPLGDNGYTWRALHVARKLEANVYQAEFPAFAQPCLRVRSWRGGRVVLVEHNVEYERIREQNPDMTDEQYWLLKEFEIGLCNLSDAVVCVSEDDRRRLAADGVGEHRLHRIPHGVDLAGCDAAAPRDVRVELGWDPATVILVYHGTYDYPPNLEAVKVGAGTILPELERRGLDVRLLAIGNCPPAESPHPRLHFPGSAESVFEWLKAADIAVVPLTQGGGTRMKIIDYFACGVPVVSTPKGMEGIPVESGREAFVEDEWGAFCDRVQELAADPGRRRAMAAAARAFVEPLDWVALAARYVELFKAL